MIQTASGTFTEEDYEEYDMNWRKLYFGHVSVADMRKYTPNVDWQAARLSMKGTTTGFKYRVLCGWLLDCDFSYASRIQVTNYVTALSRGGLIKPSDYREVIK